MNDRAQQSHNSISFHPPIITNPMRRSSAVLLTPPKPTTDPAGAARRTVDSRSLQDVVFTVGRSPVRQQLLSQSPIEPFPQRQLSRSLNEGPLGANSSRRIFSDMLFAMPRPLGTGQQPGSGRMAVLEDVSPLRASRGSAFVSPRQGNIRASPSLERTFGSKDSFFRCGALPGFPEQSSPMTVGSAQGFVMEGATLPVERIQQLAQVGLPAFKARETSSTALRLQSRELVQDLPEDMRLDGRSLDDQHRQNSVRNVVVGGGMAVSQVTLQSALLLNPTTQAVC